MLKVISGPKKPETVLPIKMLHGHTIAQSIYLSGLFVAPALCSGLGSCKLCRVRFRGPAPSAGAEERKILGDRMIKEGWRLGCRHECVEEALLELPDFIQLKKKPESRGAPDKDGFLAVDLGTTSICWQLIKFGEVLSEGRQVNPQMGAGSDVVARLGEASRPGGFERLSSLVQQELKSIISALPVQPAGICVAGNTAMSAIFLGIDPSGLARVPYKAPLSGDEEYFLPGLPSVYIPPILAPFIGGDVSAGMAALLCEAAPDAFPFVLCDLGTNGEFVLALGPDDFLATSIPLGPAIEGIGLSCGGLAGVGGDESQVITGLRMTPGGLLPNIPFDQAAAISGTGYLDLLSILLAYGVISQNGVFDIAERDFSFPARAKLLEMVRETGREKFLKLDSLSLTAGDIEELLKVKAAFSLALKSLLAEAGLQAADLKRIFLAGALGEHVKQSCLFDLGFLPSVLEGRVKVAANTSLAGAKLLQNEKMRELARHFKSCTKIYSLPEQAGFMEKYISEMAFAYQLA